MPSTRRKNGRCRSSINFMTAGQTRRPGAGRVRHRHRRQGRGQARWRSIGDKLTLRRAGGHRDPGRDVPAHEALYRGRHFPCRRRWSCDGYLGVTNLQDLARLHRWKPDQVQGLRLKFDDLFQAPRTAWSIARDLGEDRYYARDWTRTHGNLYQAIRMEKP